MDPHQPPLLALEWGRLQQTFSAYERDALAIKLASVVLFAAAIAFSLDVYVTSALTLVLWGQESVWRAFQARVARRLASVETMLASGAPPAGAAFQLHSGHAAGRRGLLGTLLEYAAAMPRPAVAFPHLVLLLINLALGLESAGAGGSPV